MNVKEICVCVFFFCFWEFNHLRYFRFRPQYHVHGQQLHHKHTQPRFAEQQQQQQQQQETNQSKSEMNVTAAASPSPPTSSVFSSYTKDSYQQQQMTLKHLQHPQSTKQMSSTTTPPSATPSPAPTPPVNIPYKIDWVFERLKNPTGFWYICSQIAIFAVGLFSKFVLGKINNVITYMHMHIPKYVCMYVCIYKFIHAFKLNTFVANENTHS